MTYRFVKYCEFYSTSKLDILTCENRIKVILIKYSRIEWFGLLTAVANGIFLGGDINRIKATQEVYFKSLDFFLFHRRANLLIAQFLFSLDSKDFPINRTQFENKDILDLYLLINEYLDLKETESSTDSIKSLFFNTFKIIQSSFNETDLRLILNLYLECYHKLLESPNTNKIKEIISSKLGIEIEIVSKFLNALKDPLSKDFSDPLSFISRVVGIKYDLIDPKWQNRRIKIGIPYEYDFLEESAIVDYNGTYYVYDVFNLYYSLIKKIYDILFNQSIFDFPDFFGKNILEPILIQRLNTQFSNVGINILNVQTKKFEYADFGINFDNTIILFEIKSIFFKPNIRYTSDYNYFFKSFDGKYVTKSGVNQQINRVVDLDKKFENFISQNSISDKKYTICTVLIAFDESLQCYGCNWYLNQKYQELIRRINLKQLSLSDHFAVITVNELELLNTKGLSALNQALIIKDYLNSSQNIIPFRTYLENHK
jgi:hypothetical protein